MISMESHQSTLDAGLRWMFDTEQPPAAIIQHHGTSRACPNNRRLRFCPAGWDGHPVVVLDVRRVEYGLPGLGPRNPLAVGELEFLMEAIEQSGASEVVSTWNGHPSITASVALARPAHPTLRAAVARYHRGCPNHHTVFCGSRGCTWYRAGRQLLHDMAIPEMVAASVTRNCPTEPRGC